MCLALALLMSTHNICFCGAILCGYPLLCGAMFIVGKGVFEAYLYSGPIFKRAVFGSIVCRCFLQYAGILLG